MHKECRGNASHGDPVPQCIVQQVVEAVQTDTTAPREDALKENKADFSAPLRTYKDGFKCARYNPDSREHRGVPHDAPKRRRKRHSRGEIVQAPLWATCDEGEGVETNYGIVMNVAALERAQPPFSVPHRDPQGLRPIEHVEGSVPGTGASKVLFQPSGLVRSRAVH